MKQSIGFIGGGRVTRILLHAFKNKNAQFSKIRVYLTGNNLFYITKYKGVSPEPRYVDSATDMGTYQSPLVPGIDRRDQWFTTRSFTIGANFVF